MEYFVNIGFLYMNFERRNEIETERVLEKVIRIYFLC